MADNVFREPTCVLFHLNGGYTRVLYERLVHYGMVDNPEGDLPTLLIPRHLRSIGSRFLVEWTPLPRGLDLSADEMRRHFASATRVLDLSGSESTP